MFRRRITTYSQHATRAFITGIVFTFASLHWDPLPGAEPENGIVTKKVVFIAGKKSHGPEGNGIHDYPWSVKLLKVMLDNSNVGDRLRVEYHLDGWPADETTLDDADAIMVISDGRDGDLYEEAPHFRTVEQNRAIAKQIARGCGFLTFHFSTFAPDARAAEILDWTGGYFDWETDGKRQWYSAIATKETEVLPAAADHPVLRGVAPFKMKEEFYYNIRFAGDAKSTTPLWKVPALDGRPEGGNVVAWARERVDGGRGFGTTCGHFYENWKHDSFRKLILNAIAWCAHIEIPAGGVDAKYYTQADITAALAGVEGTQRAVVDDNPVRVLLFAGNDAHKWHNWEKSTPAIVHALSRDSRTRVEVSHDFEDLAKKNLNEVDVIVQNNYANWQDPRSLSDAAKTAFLTFLQNGRGLVVIHFANGAYHFSLPNAGDSDWPEYRQVVRRVWNHHGDETSRSGHDAFGEFTVDVMSIESPITRGLKSFRVHDELYFRQHGDEPIEPLLAAKSEVTGRKEPLAWTYRYGKGRVFQTLLGHSEKTYDVFEPREMLRRAVAWCAGRTVRELSPADDILPPVAPLPKKPLTEGKFGKALDARVRYVEVPGRLDYRKAPLSVELWTRLFSKESYNILVASDAKSSADHWELFTEAGSGELCLYIPGCKPDHVHSGVNICDSRWHHIALYFGETRAQLVVDAKETPEHSFERVRTDAKPGHLAIGSLVEGGIGCDGLIDDVRISRGPVHENNFKKPARPEEVTLGLWNFDETSDGKLADDSQFKNAGKLVDPSSPALPPQAFVPPDGLNCEAADPAMKLTLIDRSVNDVFMAVKADGAGRIFVGGRESLFVFEPKPESGFLPKRELFRFPQDSIIIGLEYRGDDLYVLTDNALYLIPSGRTKRDNLQPKRLLWGIPLDLHVSFHCLAWGPEGDLYLNHGDPLLNYGDFQRPDHWGHWTLYSADGTRTPYTGVGSVLRVRPDGTALQVVSTGYRGPVGLAFDRNGNLFTNDNDHESMADRYAPARLVHAAPRSDFAWPRGWMASMSPERSDLLEPLAVNLGRGVPCDLAFCDDPHLPENERNGLLLCRWDRFDVARYSLRNRGASFAADEKPFLKGTNNARPVGVTVDGLGRVFVTMLYLSGNVATPHCYSDLVMMARGDSGSRTVPLVDSPPATVEMLWKELESPRKERRTRAEVELRRRGALEPSSVLTRLKQVSPKSPAFSHLVWLAGAAGGSVGDDDTIRHLVRLAGNSSAEVRLHAVRALAEHAPPSSAAFVLSHALQDDDPQVQLAAASAFFDARRELPVLELLKAARNDDDYLRQITTRLLAQRCSFDQLNSLFGLTDESDRLSAVLAAGLKLTVPGNHFVPPQELPLSYPAENAFFKLTQHFADSEAAVDLRQIGRIGSFTTGELWKFRPPSDEQRQLAEQLKKSLDDPADRVAMQAAYWLSLLRDPAVDPLLESHRLRRIAKQLENAPSQMVMRSWMIGPFADTDDMRTTSHPPEQAAIDLTAALGEGEQRRVWKLQDAGAAGFPNPSGGNSELASNYAYFRVESSIRQNALLTILSPSGARSWNNSRELTDRLPSPNPSSETRLVADLQPGSNDLLIRLFASNASEHITMQIRAKKPVSVVLPDKLDSALLRERLSSAKGADGGVLSAEFAAIDWGKRVQIADPKRGRQLFASLGCAKCHAVTANQKSAGGPSLAEARKRFTVAHVVESVLIPSRQVADAFRATTIVEVNGVVSTGLAVSETKEQLELLLPDTTRRVIRLDDIDERKTSEISPMPQGLIKTPDEIGDLAAYLLSENPSPP